MFNKKKGKYIFYMCIYIFATLFMGISEKNLTSITCNADEDYTRVTVHEYDNSEEM